ncbi:Cyclic AMP receptor 2 [Tolypocladium capitatum]|uniref:Cyclic AMP receptor 2 n=1 Tax=Tolypocladium capitatum TaxID=45235 RepID=A0A2K3QH05_9HYPO|nr:Cyclic AMP receptor 2 [Tolypocladium capitatum]
MNSLTESQRNAIGIMERTCSAVSLLGSIFTIVTFSCSSAFHEKPINRLVFFASFGNMMANVATLISNAYLNRLDSVGCQAQAMLIQWFMFADTGFMLAMAINVYLTFYRKFDAKRLRQIEPVYLLACYGVPFIPALLFLFIKHNGERVYGDATLWCWISKDVEYLRFASFYGPIWVVILITFSIYIRAGRTILENRKELREFESNIDLTSVNDEDASTTKRTEVSITAEASGSGPMAGRDPSWGDYMVRVSADNHISPGIDVASPVHSKTIYEHTSTLQLEPTRPQTSTRRNSARRRSFEFKSAAWSYSKCALLYFTSSLITWIPSTANRLYNSIHGGAVLVPLAFMSAFVLPLQGFWNCLIYTVISWGACKNLFEDMKGRGLAVSGITTSMSGANLTAGSHQRDRSLPWSLNTARSSGMFDCESVAELSRPTEG